MIWLPIINTVILLFGLVAVFYQVNEGHKNNVKLQKQVRKDDLAISLSEKIIASVCEITSLAAEIASNFSENQIDGFFIGERRLAGDFDPNEVRDNRFRQCSDFWKLVSRFAITLGFYQTVFPILKNESDKLNHAIRNSQEELLKFSVGFRRKFSEKRCLQKQLPTTDERNYVKDIIKPYESSVDDIGKLMEKLLANVKKEILEPAFNEQKII